MQQDATALRRVRLRAADGLQQLVRGYVHQGRHTTADIAVLLRRYMRPEMASAQYLRRYRRHRAPDALPDIPLGERLARGWTVIIGHHAHHCGLRNPLTGIWGPLPDRRCASCAQPFTPSLRTSTRCTGCARTRKPTSTARGKHA